jgi:hypothetical protein
LRRVVATGALVAVMAVAIPSVARADDIPQDNQLVFGISGMYLPAQNDLSSNLAGIGHYVAYSRSIDFVHVGFRLALSIASGPQYVITPDAFIGVHYRTDRFALRLEIGTGPLVNGGDGFATSYADHTFIRATAQLRVVKTVIVEAFGGPGFVISPYVAGVMAEWGLGVGWNF